MAAEVPVFDFDLPSAQYYKGQTADAMDGTATVGDGGTISYRWQISPNGAVWRDIPGANSAQYTPVTSGAGVSFYRVIARNLKGNDTAEAVSNTADVTVIFSLLTNAERTQDYLRQLRTEFTKLCRMRFLQPDGSTAFSLDGNPNNPRNTAFIQDGSITCNLQNGQRRTATVTIGNVTGEFDYAVNHVWFGQQIAIDEGLLLSDGSEYYIPQGVFYVETPTETLAPNGRTIVYNLVDKWAYLDGTLGGFLESTYEVPVGTNIFTPISAILNLDRGNGEKIDNVLPIYTEYYNGKTQQLPDGSTALMTNSPFTLRIDSDSGSYADVITGLVAMVNGLVGYDPTGALRVDPSQDNILDTAKPVQWQFRTDEAQFLGATYQTKNTEVYNDYIVIGEQLSNYSQVAGRAQNLDPSSDTNVYLIGRKTFRESASGFGTKQQCADLAEWRLKRAAVLQKAVTVSCSQIFHIDANNIITLVRTDKEGAPMERHLVQGFTRPLSGRGEMTINCTSVNDFPIATKAVWP